MHTVICIILHLLIIQLSKIVLERFKIYKTDLEFNNKLHIKAIKPHEKSQNKSFCVSILMIKVQGIDKLQHCFEKFFLGRC